MNTCDTRRLTAFLLRFDGEPTTLRRFLRRGEILGRRRSFNFLCDLFLYRFLQSFFCFFIHGKDYSLHRRIDVYLSGVERWCQKGAAVSARCRVANHALICAYERMQERES